MEDHVRALEELIRELPHELQDEVRLERRVRRRQKYLSMTWAGALREFRDQFTSLELQKRALEWWGD